MEKRYIIGLTGKMCAGKNKAAQMLECMGCAVIDADTLVHTALENAKSQIVQTFEKTACKKNICLLDGDGNINRRELGKLLFSDKKLLTLHEKIIHPMVDILLNQFIDSHPAQHVILNATVLYKTPIIKKCDFIIYIDAPFLVRLKRAKKRDSLPTLQILQRFFAQSQLFTQHKKRNADIFKVKNSFQAEKMYKELEILLKRKGVTTC